MYEDFGVFVSPKVEPSGMRAVEFRLFFPDAELDKTQYSIVPGQDGKPRISKLQVFGDFQSKLGGVDFDITTAPELKSANFPALKPVGQLYTFNTMLPDGFYSYKYWVTFENGKQRECGDPCTKYGDGVYKKGEPQEVLQTAGFVVGGNSTEVQSITKRLPQKDLIIYELMVDDFTFEFLEGRAPFDAVKDKLQYLIDLDINAIEFMPWTAFIEDSFSWGYDPYLYYSVENRYTTDQKEPLDKLFRLQTLINLLHENGIHVIMDGVFHQVNAPGNLVEILKQPIQKGMGFPYYWLYENPLDSPFIRKAQPGEETFGQQLINFNNHCATEFITGSCIFFFSKYKIDGIRFDNAIGFYSPGSMRGIPEIISKIRTFLVDNVIENVSLILEDLNGFQEVDDTNKINATGCWFDEFRYSGIDTKYMRVLNSNKDFGMGKAPVSYIENHDHSTLVTRFFGRDKWFKTQPYAIALLTSPGTVMLHNGQEFGDDYFFPEPGAFEPEDNNRVRPRPLHWNEFSNDKIGKQLYGIYQKLITIRKTHSALRSPNFYPDFYAENFTHFNPEGYGIDVEKQIIIFHRWEQIGTKIERFIIVINFSTSEQFVDIPFPANEIWQDLLNDSQESVTNFRLLNQQIHSNWGRIYFQ
jgi:pullulanase